MAKWRNYRIVETQTWVVTARNKTQAMAFVRGGQLPRWSRVTCEREKAKRR
jgi:hypothetical protein